MSGVARGRRGATMTAMAGSTCSSRIWVKHCRLYHNEGDGTFKDVAPKLGVTGTDMSFACWFWDYDNDGRFDLYVNDYRARVAEVLASAMGVKIAGLEPAPFLSQPRTRRLPRRHHRGRSRPGDGADGLELRRCRQRRLPRHLPGDRRHVLRGPGRQPDVPRMSRALDSRTSRHRSGTGHLQKGHGVSFADYDSDGDLDLFVELGGATPGDQGFNALFQNPGQGRHWLKVKLVGTRTNRAAIGASIQVDLNTSGRSETFDPSHRRQ